jgi:hypothetical protein
MAERGLNRDFPTDKKTANGFLKLALSGGRFPMRWTKFF